MPDEIKRNSKRKDQADHIKEVAKNLMRHIEPQIRQLSYDEIVDCYWSKEDRRAISNVFGTLVANTRNMSQNFTLTRPVKIENEALPLPLEVTVEVMVREPESANALLWPKAMMDQAFGYRIPIPSVKEMVQEIAETAFIKGLFVDMVSWLADNCKTHQQAAWLLPMWTVVLRRAGMEGIANNCEGTVRALPMLPPFMRQKLRYINQIMAGHMLMETFSHPPVSTDDHLCTMRLLTDHTYQQLVGDAHHWVTLKM